MSVLFYPESIRILGSDTSGNNVMLCKMAVDDIANLPSANAFISDGYVLSMGSTAIVINDNSKHRLNGNGNWVQIAAGTSTYTRAEIDTMVSAIDAALAEVENKGAKNDFDIENLIKSAISENVTYSLSGDSLTVSSNGRYARASIPYKFKAGTTVFSVVVSEFLLSGGTMYIRFATQSSSSGQIASQIAITNNGQYQREITVNADTDGFVVYYINGSPGAYVNSAVFTNNMISTKAEWNISQAYIPYAPTNRQLYEMILQLQGG